MVSPNGLNHWPAEAGHESRSGQTPRESKASSPRPRGRSRRCLVRRGDVIFAHLDVAHDVLADHDGVIDQDADRQRQAEQGHGVEREAEDQTAMKEASTETGSARPVMTVERHELRNRNTTSTVSSAPSNSVCWTSRTACVTRDAESRRWSSSTPFGSVFRAPPAIAHDRLADFGGAVSLGLLDVDADRYLARCTAPSCAALPWRP